MISPHIMESTQRLCNAYKIASIIRWVPALLAVLLLPSDCYPIDSASSLSSTSIAKCHMGFTLVQPKLLRMIEPPWLGYHRIDGGRR